MQIEDRLNIEYPLIQAPMAGVQNWELAVAVSEAGGLGSIPCGMLNPDQVEQELNYFKQHSNKPYNLNFFCHTMPPVDEQKEARWLHHLSTYYAEVGLAVSAPPSALRMPFNDEMADRIEPFKPPVISFHFGLPARHLVERVKSWGTIILSSATTLEEATWLEAHGVDVLIAQGIEAGGHRGMFSDTQLDAQLPTKRLVKAIAAALSTPVIAAGGIASKQDIQDALNWGAAGVQLGTAFLLCNEANTSAAYRSALRDQKAETHLTNVFSGRPARGIENRLMKELGFISDKAPDFPYAATAVAPLRAYSEQNQLGDFLPMWSGTNRSGCHEGPAAELVHSLSDEPLS
ncbi:2-nitropropane dioxygenase [Oleiphilus sp. HI0071]|uniref:NAD(P)H-dependent flavin oxidoreductase n=1 Tax=unclassified Oleiphilus TaxID=2631174 RepID=UPI0007C2AE23|nr:MULTISPECIES: nitronate monooxygenase [unclassified Oleiphilus]KZY61738.1 2-nitropropane dioxygenase [Oleiphilus sp. HI0065]KZY79891.1 2-nitropropane dioxygenase [Oleiphilus sp. HI0071]KZY92659.1 2-nitropropane dioxygenase [Oleiphilus sp. HI0073]KZZ50494.1 2-nitropropane dioxygenase [Oleiphilus sp. HI0118]KZZ50743.1 2-nitropropane dioxygenase [Oleiphilus sp. HI0122]KZZ77121.1 2-nitropropane dioxygenase [Oleiphilus sp. HI0130]KZZ82439.1 2-nitropropane dioxygenase [Oleiphilus sp. HI0133]